MLAGTLPRFTALRYVQPLREGGSLPAVVDTDNGLYVVKFRGAGQGQRALVAEIIVGRLVHALDLPVPDLAIIDVPHEFGRSEPDPEIRDLLRASHGVNVGLRYLDGSFNLALSVSHDIITDDFASRLVWLDAFVTNPDRTHRNSNLLISERQPWLIDHGAALYAHHDWGSVDDARVRTPFPLIRDHVLITRASGIGEVDEMLAARLTEHVLRDAVDSVPDELLVDEVFSDANAARERYLGYLVDRLRAPRAFADEAVRARQLVLDRPLERRSERR